MSTPPSDFSILLLTLEVATVSTLAILPPALVAAWWLSRSRSAAGSIAETVISLPMVLPPTAIGLLLLEVLRRDGLTGELLASAGIEVLFTWKAVVIACAVMSFPLLVRPVRAAFEEIDPRLIAVARTLGANRLRVFLRVTLPLAWRGIFTGGLLAFSRALGEFGATIIVAGNIPGRTQTLALAIFSRSEMGDDRAALELVALTVVIAFAAMWTTEFVSRQRSRMLAA